MRACFAVLQALLVGFALHVLATPAKADEIRPFAMDFTQTSAENWSLDWKQPVVTRGRPQLIVPDVPDNCMIVGSPTRRPAPMALIGHAEVRCNGAIAGGQIALPQLSGNADALVRIVPLDAPPQSHRLTASAPSVEILAQPGRWQVFTSYLWIGAEHILLGWDHLLFVIALLLLVVRGWPVIKAATAFTIAHSITLVATTLGYAGLPQRPVEILIALSIVFLAVELARRDAPGEEVTWTQRYPWVVAFGFGLLHGFGFAGALRDIGLPEGEVPAALLAFNLGVEAGQLFVIAVVMALRAAIARWAPGALSPVLRAVTYAIGGIAAYWLIDRLIG